MKKATIKYNLSAAGQKASILAGGDGAQTQTLETEVTPELLEVAYVSWNGAVVLDLTRKLENSLRVNHDGSFDQFYSSNSPFSGYFNSPQTVEALITWEKGRREYLNKLKASMQPEMEAKKAEYAARQAERAAWIETHGSDYLRRATALGYNCQRQYVTERAALELPGYEVDFDDRAAWKSRSCPSEAALGEVEQLIRQGYDAEVVWLIEPIQEPEYSDDDDYCFEPCETIVVRNYLGKYDLVKEI